jgi:flagellar hook-associated protein FlgK
MSTQTELKQDFIYFNQSSVKKLDLLQKQLQDQIERNTKETDQMEKVIDNLFRCDYCSKMLLNHINDLLDFAKLENNKF